MLKMVLLEMDDLSNRLDKISVNSNEMDKISSNTKELGSKGLSYDRYIN